MKKALCTLLVILMFGLLAIPAMAAQEAPEITMQPQSPNYPEYSVAIYTVKVNGSNLSATWFIEYQGNIYNASQIGGVMQPWESFAGEAYGARQLDANTFAFIFEGIEYDLDGAYIWCVIEDGHYDVTSQKVRISVGNPNSPPEILSIPSQVTVEQGEYAEIRCITKSPDGSQLSFLWYESDTGRMEDIRAVNRGTETTDYLICDTSYTGTRNYICFINTTNGGFANSSFVTVTVTPKAQTAPQPDILTTDLPDAVVGAQYALQLQCADPKAEFSPYYNPGGSNDLDKTGLSLSMDGWLTGTPTVAGTYSFCVSTIGAGGEDYRVFTLNVVPPVQDTISPAEEIPQTSTPAPETVPDTTAPTQDATALISTTTPPSTEGKITGLSWLLLAAVAFGATCIGVATAVLLIRKNSIRSVPRRDKF